MVEVIEKLKERKIYLERIIKSLEKKQETYPQGHLRIKGKDGKAEYWHINEKGDHIGKYMPRKEEKLAIRLAQKDYEISYLKQAKEEVKSIERFLKTFTNGGCSGCYENLSEYRKKIVNPFEVPDNDYLKIWEAETYEGKGFADSDTTNYITEKGERVRSKSEIIIANALFKNNIPYKYECPLNINGTIVYIDFTTLNLRKRKVIYWEHFGMMSDIEYCNNAIYKLNRYIQSDIYPGDSLITTYETINKPLDIKTVNRLIKHFLL